MKNLLVSFLVVYLIFLQLKIMQVILGFKSSNPIAENTNYAITELWVIMSA